MVVSRLRILIALLIVALAGTLAAPAASPAKSHKLPHRQGGAVHKAWPAKHVRGKRAKRPRKALSRFLAKQVGPTRLKVKQPKRMQARVSSAGPLVTFLPAATTTKLRLVRFLIKQRFGISASVLIPRADEQDLFFSLGFGFLSVNRDGIRQASPQQNEENRFSHAP